jgi:O-antigen/teichoic acid export membrane protein
LPEETEVPANSGNERAKNIVQGMGSLTIQNLGTSLLGFLFLVGVIRLIPLFQYGVYSAIVVTVTIASAFAGFGLSLAATRYVALLRREDEKTSWVAARKIVLLSVVLTIVVTAFYLALSPLLSIYFTKSTSWTWAFLLGGVWLFSTSISSTLQGIILGLKKYVLLAKILFVSRLSMVVFAIGILFFDHSVGIAILAWVIFNMVILFWILGLIGKNLIDTHGTFSYGNILRYVLPLGVAGVIAAFATSSDTVLVGGYLNPASLAVYGAATTISVVLGIVVLGPLTSALLPEVSSSKSVGDASYGVRLAFKFTTLAILPASLLVSGVSTQLLALFAGGGAYLTGNFTLELIALFYVFLAIQNILLVLLQAVGRTMEIIIVGIVTAVTDIGLALFLVPHFGLSGAVVSRVAVYLDGAFVSIYLARNYMKNLDKSSYYLKGALAAGLPFVIIFALSSFVSSRVLTLVPYTIVYIALFLACVKWFRLLTDQDRAFLSQTLPPRFRKFVGYF